jgi:hypothetical protein
MTRKRSRAHAQRARQRRRDRRRRAQKPSTLVRALTASALALPGIAGPAAADSPPAEPRSDYRYSRYAEDALPTRKVATGGERDRYEIDIHQFRFESAVSDRIGVGIDVTHEAMSGATPWYITPDTNGDPVQVMTGATIDEARTDAMISGDYYFERGKGTLAGGISAENDYLALSGSLGGERNFNEKNTTLAGGIGLSIDQLSPSDTERYPTRPESEDKQSYSGYLALSQVLGDSSIGQLSLKYQHATGFLSDPYKLAFVDGIPETDERPDTRNQISALARLRRHFRSLDGSLHLDYTFYGDDWELYSHTVELAWYQTFFDQFRLIPSVRYYSQSQAEFYAPYYNVARSDGLRSSDYRLSPFGAYSYKIAAELPFEFWDYKWHVAAGFERYVSDADVALESVTVANPGLVSYNLFTVGLTARF